jgi:superfamily I DNA/RNA helicase
VYGLISRVLDGCKADVKRADFNDQLWMPIVHSLRPEKCDVLFLDEAQDLNKAQQSFSRRLCPDGRIVVVGDVFQAIYGFRGADVESIPTLQRELAATSRGVVRLPLTATRRCPWSHVELARHLVPDLESMPEAIEGTIDTMGEERAADAMRPSDMVLCRVNAPLVSAAFRLLKRDVPAIIKGRNFGADLVRFVQGLHADSTADLSEQVDEHHARETKRLDARRARPEAYVTLNDKCECVHELASACKSVAEVVAKIEALFSDAAQKHMVILSSVHRAKGLEADRVFVLKPELMPHPLASQAWEQVQERNIAYVAATRAKRDLVFVGDIPSIFGGY